MSRQPRTKAGQALLIAAQRDTSGRYDYDLTGSILAIEQEARDATWEVVRKNVHRQTEQDGYICEHRNQHKTGWQCGRSATGLLTDE